MKHKGKLFIADKAMIPVKDAKLFPTIKNATNLSGNQREFPKILYGKTTLLSFSARDAGLKMSTSFTQPFEETFHNKKNIQSIELNLIQGRYKLL